MTGKRNHGSSVPHAEIRIKRKGTVYTLERTSWKRNLLCNKFNKYNACQQLTGKPQSRHGILLLFQQRSHIDKLPKYFAGRNTLVIKYYSLTNKQFGFLIGI